MRMEWPRPTPLDFCEYLIWEYLGTSTGYFGTQEKKCGGLVCILAVLIIQAIAEDGGEDGDEGQEDGQKD